MDKLSEHAIRMLEIANREGVCNSDVDAIAKAIYDTILQVQMLEMAKRKTEPQNEYCPTCGQMYPKWMREQNEPKTEPQTDCAWMKGEQR